MAHCFLAKSACNPELLLTALYWYQGTDGRTDRQCGASLNWRCVAASSIAWGHLVVARRSVGR